MCTPEGALTKKQKEFIGTTFETPRGGVLTVTGVVGKTIGNTPIFKGECSICSKDRELFPEGSIKSTKNSLVIGQCPCGCAKSVKWTEEQTKIRVIRECRERSYTFHGWSGRFNGSQTFLDLSNPETGNRWQTTTVNRFFTGHGDPVAGIQSKSIDDIQHIKDFMNTGAFLEGTRFTRSDRKNSKGIKNYWVVGCPKCSNDEYVLNGLCDGKFESKVTNLKDGKIPCRCSDKFRWTQQQREFQIQKVLSEDGGKFITWEKGIYKNCYSKFNWLCSDGHECGTTVASFLNCNTRCGTCHKRGYDPNKTGNLYLVEWYGFGESYLKKGITNNTTLFRVKGQFGKGKLDYKIIREVSGDGKVVQEAEKYLNSVMDGYACPKEWLPDGYTETEHNTPENYKFLMEYFDELETKLNAV